LFSLTNNYGVTLYTYSTAAFFLCINGLFIDSLEMVRVVTIAQSIPVYRYPDGTYVSAVDATIDRGMMVLLRHSRASLLLLHHGACACALIVIDDDDDDDDDTLVAGKEH
jgi:hypothetical protein